MPLHLVGSRVAGVDIDEIVAEVAKKLEDMVENHTPTLPPWYDVRMPFKNTIVHVEMRKPAIIHHVVEYAYDYSPKEGQIEVNLGRFSVVRVTIDSVSSDGRTYVCIYYTKTSQGISKSCNLGSYGFAFLTLPQIREALSDAVIDVKGRTRSEIDSWLNDFITSLEMISDTDVDAGILGEVANNDVPVKKVRVEIQTGGGFAVVYFNRDNRRTSISIGKDPLYPVLEIMYYSGNVSNRLEVSYRAGDHDFAIDVLRMLSEGHMFDRVRKAIDAYRDANMRAIMAYMLIRL